MHVGQQAKSPFGILFHLALCLQQPHLDSPLGSAASSSKGRRPSPYLSYSFFALVGFIPKHSDSSPGKQADGCEYPLEKEKRIAQIHESSQVKYGKQKVR